MSKTATVHRRNRKATINIPDDVKEAAKADGPDLPSPVLSPAQLLEAYKASFDRSVSSIGGILDSTALSIYCAVGEDCLDTMLCSRNLFDAETRGRLGESAKSQWSQADYDDQCNQLATRCKVNFPHLFGLSKEESDKSEAKGKKRDPVRVTDYILAFASVEALRPFTGDCIDNLSYYLVVNYVARKMVSFSRTDLTSVAKSDWSEFARINVPKVANGSILVRDFLSLMEQHEERLGEAKMAEKNVGKTPAQIGKETADAEIRKASREAASKETKVRTTLSTSLSDALNGVLTPQQTSDIIVKSAKDAGVSLPMSVLDPEKVGADDVLDLLKSLFVKKRFDALRTICAACGEMANMLDLFDSPKPSPNPQTVAKVG